MGRHEVPSWPALVWTVLAHFLGTLKTTNRTLREVDAVRVEQQFREQQLFVILSEGERVLLRSPRTSSRVPQLEGVHQMFEWSAFRIGTKSCGMQL